MHYIIVLLYNKVIFLFFDFYFRRSTPAATVWKVQIKW